MEEDEEIYKNLGKYFARLMIGESISQEEKNS